MLVLSRREREKIVFPALNTSVEILEVKAGRVRLGIEAPPEIKVLRDEVLKSSQAVRSGLQQLNKVAASNGFDEAQLRKARHDLRNSLNTASIGLALARRQLKSGMMDGAEATLEKIAGGFHSLESDVQRLVETTHSKATNQRQPEALLVEDDTNECELLAGFLRMAGYKVNTAQDGAAALDQLRGHTPDVMLLDMNMPRCDGVTTVRMIRRNPALADLKIYAVTGYSAQQLGVDQQQAGLNGWFQKPLDPERLLGELQSLRTQRVPA